MINENNVRLAITLSKGLLYTLNYYSENFGISKSDVIKWALHEFSVNHEHDFDLSIEADVNKFLDDFDYPGAVAGLIKII